MQWECATLNKFARTFTINVRYNYRRGINHFYCCEPAALFPFSAKFSVGQLGCDTFRRCVCPSEGAGGYWRYWRIKKIIGHCKLYINIFLYKFSVNISSHCYIALQIKLKKDQERPEYKIRLIFLLKDDYMTSLRIIANWIATTVYCWNIA